MKPVYPVGIFEIMIVRKSYFFFISTHYRIEFKEHFESEFHNEL